MKALPVPETKRSTSIEVQLEINARFVTELNILLQLNEQWTNTENIQIRVDEVRRYADQLRLTVAFKMQNVTVIPEQELALKNAAKECDQR